MLASTLFGFPTNTEAKVTIMVDVKGLQEKRFQKKKATIAWFI